MNATVTSGTRLFRTPIGKRRERIASRGGREETSRRVRAKAFPSRDCPSHHIPKNSANNANTCIPCTPSAPRTSARSSCEGVREDSGRGVRGEEKGGGGHGLGRAYHIPSRLSQSRGGSRRQKRARLSRLFPREDACNTTLAYWVFDVWGARSVGVSSREKSRCITHRNILADDRRGMESVCWTRPGSFQDAGDRLSCEITYTREYVAG